jgi:hypothetical protein
MEMISETVCSIVAVSKYRTMEEVQKLRALNCDIQGGSNMTGTICV